LHGDVPDRKTRDAILRVFFELRPVDNGGTIGIERIQQRLAEQPLVLVTAHADRAVAGPGAGIGGQIGGNRKGWTAQRWFSVLASAAFRGREIIPVGARRNSGP